MMTLEEARRLVEEIPQRPENDPGDYYANKAAKSAAIEKLLQRDCDEMAQRFLLYEYELSREVGD